MTALFEHIQTLAAQPGRRFASILEAGAWRDQTYADLWRRALSFAGLFRASGLAPDDVVCLIVKPGADAYAAFLGGMAAGGLPSFLPYPNSKHDTGLYWAQHKTLFGHARPRLILTWDELAPEVEPCADGSGARVLRLSEVEKAEPLLAPVPRGEDDLALLQHSSGTTGLKKGVALSYGAIARQVDAYAKSLGVSSDRPVRLDVATDAAVGCGRAGEGDARLASQLRLPASRQDGAAGAHVGAWLATGPGQLFGALQGRDLRRFPDAIRR